jgi:hypothetical protein
MDTNCFFKKTRYFRISCLQRNRRHECCRSRSAKCAVSGGPFPKVFVRCQTQNQTNNRRYIMATAKKTVKKPAAKVAAKKPAAKVAAKKPAAKAAAKKPAAKAAAKKPAART